MRGCEGRIKGSGVAAPLCIASLQDSHSRRTKAHLAIEFTCYIIDFCSLSLLLPHHAYSYLFSPLSHPFPIFFIFYPSVFFFSSSYSFAITPILLYYKNSNNTYSININVTTTTTATITTTITFYIRPLLAILLGNVTPSLM